MLEKLSKQLKLEKIIKLLTCLFLFILPWQTIWIYKENFFGNYRNQFGTLGFYGSEILLWIIIILFMIWYWRKWNEERGKWNEGFRLSGDRIFILFVLLFVLYCFVSSFWALNFSLAWQQALRIMEMFLLFFVLYLGPLSKKEIIRWFILGSVIPIIFGLYQFIFQFTFSNKYLGLSIHPIWEAGSSVVVGSFGRLLRSYGSFSHPNIFGGYLLVVLLASFLFFKNYKNNPWLAYSFNGILLLTMFFTFSRSALIAILFLLIGFLIFSLKTKNQKIKKISIFSLVLFFVLLFSLWSIFQSRFFSGSINETNSIEERVSGFSQALDLWQGNKWLGVGISNYTINLYNFNSDSEPWLIQPVHNIGFLILTELGLVGVVLSILLIISFFVWIYPYFSKIEFFWLIYAVFCFSVLVLLDHYLFTTHVGLLLSSLFFWLILDKKTV